MGIGKQYGKIIENVEIESAGAEGMSVARIDGQVVFVKGGVPGDVADIRLYAKKKKVLFAEIARLHHSGTDRVSPFCSHFGTCGGCKWQQMSYNAQLHWKERQVKDALERLGKIQCREWLPIKGAEKTTAYRNKVEYTFSNRKWQETLTDDPSAIQQNGAGFHLAGRFDKILDIDTCYLQDERGNTLRKFVRDYGIRNNIPFYDVKAQQGVLRNMVIRNTSLDQWMVVLTFGGKDDETVQTLLKTLDSEFPWLYSIEYGINNKVNDSIYDIDLHSFKGPGYITEKLEDLQYRIRPKSFFQTNTEQALNLYRLTRDFAGLTGNEVVYDLYCGTGSISLFIARQAKKVYGIESVPQAITDANENANLNGITNVEFTTGDMRFVFNEAYISQSGRPDVIITDPPRSGMHPDVVEQILGILPSRIVYVSCNPATQARDLAMMSNHYDVVKTAPVDMFPHTHHVENVTLLELRTDRFISAR